MKIYLDSNYKIDNVSSHSKYVLDFEEKVAAYLGISKEYVLATNSGTSALELALLGAGIKQLDKVLIPAITYIATANAISHVGAIPVLCDVDRNTFLIDIESNCEKNIKSIISVDLYGNIYKELMDFDNYKSVIIDASESFMPGILDDYLLTTRRNMFWCYSFNGNKILTTGAGGLIINGNSILMNYIRRLSKQGRSPDYKSTLRFDHIGYNYGMAGWNAFLGLKNLESTNEFIQYKSNINQIYRKELSGLISFQQIDYKSNYWMTAVIFPEHIRINELQEYLETYNIPTRRIFRPINHHTSYSSSVLTTHRNKINCKNAEYIYNHGLCLPSSILNSDEDIYKVCNTIKDYLVR